MISGIDHCGGLELESIASMVKRMKAQSNRAPSHLGAKHEGIARDLRERICMALIVSNNCMADVIPVVAPAIEAYINGTVTLPPTEENKPAKKESIVDLREGITALVESIYPHLKVVGMTANEPGVKSKQDPFGNEGSIFITVKSK